MAYGLLGIDIVLRLALIEKKVAVKWQTVEETEVASQEDTEVVQRDTKLEPESASKEDLDQPGAAHSEPLEQDQPESLTIEKKSSWLSRRPPIFTL